MTETIRLCRNSSYGNEQTVFLTYLFMKFLTVCNILTLDQAVNQETDPSGRIYSGITLTCRRVEFGAIATPTGSRWWSNNYITRGHRKLKLVGVSGSWSSSCSSRQWEPAPSRGLGSSGPPIKQPSRMRKKCCYSQRNLGSICCSLFRL